MPRNINQRLSQIGNRLAKVDRRLGFLTTRLYFQPDYQNWVEVDIQSATDSGESPKNLQVGIEIYAHRFSFQINRLWMERYTGISGAWAISTSGNPADRQLAELESQSFNDKDGYASVTLRIAQDVEVEFPPVPPQVILPDTPANGYSLPLPPNFP